MKILSEYFGYLVPTCPIDGEYNSIHDEDIILTNPNLGQVFPDAGEKRTCIFTLQN